MEEQGKKYSCRECGAEYPNIGLARSCETRHKKKEEAAQPKGPYVFPREQCPPEVFLKRKGDFVRVILFGTYTDDGIEVQKVEYGR